MSEFITVHDTGYATRKRPEGHEVRVRASSIDTIRGYSDGLVRAVLGVHGQFIHVSETEEEILEMIDTKNDVHPSVT